jgi:hypothetical protein
MSFLVPKSKILNFFKKIFKPVTFILKKSKGLSKPIVKYTKKRTKTEFWEFLGFVLVILVLLLIPYELSKIFALLFTAGLSLWYGLRIKNVYLKQVAYFLAIMTFVFSMGSFFFYSQAWIPGKTILILFLLIFSISIGINYIYIKGYYIAKKMMANNFAEISKAVSDKVKEVTKKSKEENPEKKKTLKKPKGK